ncbi:MAG: hypothetical protein AB1607_16990 [Chloroflexota bacterium]
MRKSVLYILTVFLVLLFGYGTYLLLSLRNRENSPDIVVGPSVGDRDLPAGELYVGESFTTSGAPFKEINISNVWINDSRKYLSSDGETEVVDLELGFLSGGMRKYFSVTMGGVVNLGEFSKKDGDYKLDNVGIVPVGSVDFIKGEHVTLILAYIMAGQNSSGDALDRFCKASNDPVCDFYPGAGFGKAPVESTTLSKVVGGNLENLNLAQFAVRSYTRNFVIPKVE